MTFYQIKGNEIPGQQPHRHRSITVFSEVVNGQQNERKNAELLPDQKKAGNYQTLIQKNVQNKQPVRQISNRSIGPDSNSQRFESRLSKYQSDR